MLYFVCLRGFVQVMGRKDESQRQWGTTLFVGLDNIDDRRPKRMNSMTKHGSTDGFHRISG